MPNVPSLTWEVEAGNQGKWEDIFFFSPNWKHPPILAERIDGSCRRVKVAPGVLCTLGLKDWNQVLHRGVKFLLVHQEGQAFCT